ncbi:MAG: hypothetical protein MUP41_03895 [Desulfobacterales bacterium]|nr:hypothetical protein [Desulfobacterales bacterium]
MKKMILLSLLVLSIPAIVYSQDKVEAPVWNVADKWILSEDVIITVVDADENSYTVKYITSRGELTLICEKSSLNRLYYMGRDKRIKYDRRNKRLFNFPLDIGKTWKDQYITKQAALASQEITYLETFTVLGWEEVAVQAGKFKALKIEYKQETVGQAPGRPKEGKAWYWYSPDVKYIVKCQYEKTDYWDATDDWELISFKLKQ